ncbi:MAG TPA: alpha/beta fold hydrolase [Solirubrobacteraceae bacterium]|nr:alpha/beta fold hydrolase [Solirubrobacteraceae bacterium]
MAEQLCTLANGHEVCYETFGDPADPALLLMMGLATQMLGWHEDFCAELAGRGFHVIRYDNRDVGRSQVIEGRTPTTLQLLRRDKRAAIYSLDDMAADAAGLLDHLGIEQAHIMGASMGGMIAQTMAARYPDRVLSLVSMLSNTGARWSGQPSPRLYHVLLKNPPRDREGYQRHAVWVFSKIGSPGFERDDEDLKRIAGMSFDRGINPAGTARQLAAIIHSGDRTPLLRTIKAPTLVIHGTKDRLVPASGGRATARAIPGARLLLIEGMGHDIPRVLWPRMLDAIEQNAARAGAPAAA